MNSGDGKEERLREVIADYLEAVDDGRRPDLEELLKLHPEIADELRVFVEDEGELQRLRALSPADAGSLPAPPLRVGDYEIEAEIARGGMGVVYRALHVKLGRSVAIKMILAGSLAGPEEMSRFRREAEAAARLDHPHIVPIYEIGDHGGLPYFSMKLIEGESLAQQTGMLRDQPDAAVRLLEPVARAVHHAHLRGILHRDLKPANILIDPDGRAHVTDFGLSQAMEPGRTMTQTGAILGTPSYMSPEQALGKTRKLGPGTDIYSLGSILYELLAGRPPFREDSSLATLRAVVEREPPRPSTLNPKVSRDLETVVLKCLEKEPAARYSNAGELADDLQRYLARVPVAARRVHAAERLWRWCRRNPVPAGLSALVALLLVGLTVVSWTFTLETRERLWASYLSQARHGRLGVGARRRSESLEALAAAARIRGSEELRSEAIGCLALPELEPLHDGGYPFPRTGSYGSALSPTFDRYASSSEDGKVSIRRLDDGREEMGLDGAGGSIRDLKLRNDGNALAFLCGRGSQAAWKIWDLASRGLVTLEGPSGSHENQMDFDPGGRHVAHGNRDGSICFHRSEDGLETARLPPAPGRGPVGAIAYQPQGRLLALVVEGSPYRVQLLKLPHGEADSEFTWEELITTIAWHPDGVHLAVGCHERISIWDPRSGRTKALLAGHQAAVTGLSFDPRGELLASTSWDGTMRLWSLATGREVLRVPGTVGAQFSADGEQVGSVFGGSRVRAWKVMRGSERPVLLEDRATRDGILTVTAAGGRFLLVSGYGGLRLRDRPGGRAVAWLPVGDVYTSLWDPAGDSFITWGAAGLHRWPVRTGPASGRDARKVQVSIGPPLDLRLRGSSRIGVLAASNDRRVLVALTDGNKSEATVVEGASGETRAVLHGPPGLWYLDLSPEGRWIAGGTLKARGPVRIWEVGREGPLLDLPVPANAQVRFSPDGLWLVTSSGDECCFWETGRWSPRWRIPREGAAGLTGQVAFSADGSLAALNLTLNEARLVDPATGGTLARLPSPDADGIRHLSFSTAGELVAALANNRIEIWDLPAIRRRLAAIALDWDHPPPAPSACDLQPEEIEAWVDLGPLAGR